ncbi:MAG: hypothetical protein ABL907_08555 [Hyphomicrobium sp.]
MSLIASRVHSQTSAFQFLSRAVIQWEHNAARIASRIHDRLGMSGVPLPSIHDEFASLCSDDDVICAQAFGGRLNAEIEDEIVSAIAAKFSTDKAEFIPKLVAIKKIVGSKLAMTAFPLLSASEKISIIRALSQSDAKALCERRLASKQRQSGMSVATL